MNLKAIYEYVFYNYPDQYLLVIEGGKLDGNWSNVADHCFIQAIVTEILYQRLKPVLPAGSAKLTLEAVEAAICHDWDKRLEKKPEDFTEEEKTHAAQLFTHAQVKDKLLRATKPQFLLRVKNHPECVSLTERLQFFIDDIVHDKVMLFDDRVSEVEKRSPQPGGPELEAQLGRKYWDAERELGHDVEMTILHYGNFATPQGLVDYLNTELERRFPG